MREEEQLGRKVVVKAYRKHGNGAIGSDRKGQTGKRGIIYELHGKNGEKELARFERPTFKALKKVLFSTNLIPRHVSIKSSGETIF